MLNVKNAVYWNLINDNIVVVTIDNKTLQELWRFPFDRKYYAELIEKLNSMWASVIWFDVIFAEENKENPASDEILSEAIKKAWNVVLWGSTIVVQIDNKSHLWIEKPIEKFYKYVAWFWVFTPEVSSSWNVISFEPSKKLVDYNMMTGIYSHFWVELLKVYYSKNYQTDFTKDFWRDKNYFYLTQNQKVPYSKTWGTEVLIKYIQAPTQWSSKITNFENYSFVDILKWQNFEPDDFEGKIVIVWATAKWIKDVFQTPNWIEYWVLIHANILNTLMLKEYITYLPEVIEWSLIFCVIVMSLYFSLSPSTRITIIVNIAIAIMFLVFYPLFILVFTSSIWLHTFELFLTLPFTIAIWNALKYSYENNNKYKLSKALSEYVSKAIVKEILRNSWDIKLDWEIRKLTIFFSDIEWFTTISEKFSPQELVWFLRNYLSYMSNIILDNNWFINKYEWDAIMSLWWTFLEHEKDSYNACLSAIEQQKILKELNKNWSEMWLPEIRVRIWLHTWTAIVWNIWAVWRKIEYTALWDSVNLASRLEWINKFYWTFICASWDVYNETKDFFEYRYLDKIMVKWKEKPIEIYELLSKKWELTEEKKKIVEDFAFAISVYNQKNFSEAKQLFSEIYKNFSDSPSKTYIERCDFYLNNPEKSEWELIWKFEQK